ncbi:MAG: tripartite tricarboxylate transporter TctB family protein [Pseudomonadota bacterium]
MKIAADRLLGLALIGLAVFVAVQAINLEVPFNYEPVGPRAFPLGLSILLAALSLVLVLKPGADGQWPHKALALKLLLVLGLLVVYTMLFTRLGFIPTTFVVVAALARLFEATWGKAMVTGAVMAVGSFLLFTEALGISLPTGYWLSAII